MKEIDMNDLPIIEPMVQEEIDKLKTRSAEEMQNLSKDIKAKIKAKIEENSVYVDADTFIPFVAVDEYRYNIEAMQDSVAINGISNGK